jgi:hypothetical protein
VSYREIIEIRWFKDPNSKDQNPNSKDQIPKTKTQEPKPKPKFKPKPKPLISRNLDGEEG